MHTCITANLMENSVLCFRNVNSFYHSMHPLGSSHFSTIWKSFSRLLKPKVIARLHYFVSSLLSFWGSIVWTKLYLNFNTRQRHFKPNKNQHRLHVHWMDYTSQAYFKSLLIDFHTWRKWMEANGYLEQCEQFTQKSKTKTYVLTRSAKM